MAKTPSCALYGVGSIRCCLGDDNKLLAVVLIPKSGAPASFISVKESENLRLNLDEDEFAFPVYKEVESTTFQILEKQGKAKLVKTPSGPNGELVPKYHWKNEDHGRPPVCLFVGKLLCEKVQWDEATNK